MTLLIRYVKEFNLSFHDNLTGTILNKFRQNSFGICTYTKVPLYVKKFGKKINKVLRTR